MIARQELLSDLQDLLKRLEADLLDRSDSTEVPEVRDSLRAEYEKAKQAERTAQNYEDWRSDYITQVAAAWVLSCVFVRFLEDNLLIDPPKISGPGERLGRARDEHEIYFRQSPTETDREYLLAVFDELAKLPGSREIFGEHNPIHELPGWLSGDAAGELLRFFRKIDANSGVLIHDFTDPEWDTRFLGDLYQDLSEAARKKYALLQTPEFVEEFILDRTLDPALDEFGLDAPPVTDHEGKPVTEAGFRMIDPACGSGHFLLGAFPRILARWQKQDPDIKVRELVQRTLGSIHGVDINPFAVAIARFRLLLAALKASNIRRLVDAPPFRMNLACGDSLYHGRQRQLTLDDDWTDESHYFQTEDTDILRRILREETFHAVVANPPYITVKDKAANSAYRRLYSTCHMKYSLSVPFMERIFRLANRGCDRKSAAGYIGQITSNSFMKREFGRKVIEDFFPTVDLAYVIDTSGAYIPGHGTPTTILLGRNRIAVGASIRTVMGIEGELSTPEDPRFGEVWKSIQQAVDSSDFQNAFVSSCDSDRDTFHQHPWSIGGGGAAELKELLDKNTDQTLGDEFAKSGFMAIPGEDEAYVAPEDHWERMRCSYVPFAVGDDVRDWTVAPAESVPFMYDANDLSVVPLESHGSLARALWPFRENLRNRLMFGKRPLEAGLTWYELRYFSKKRYEFRRRIAFPEVATHNHFALSKGKELFKHSVQILDVPEEMSDETMLGLLGALNSSTACFWLKQVCHNKGSTVDQHGARQRTSPFEDFYAFNGTKLADFPVSSSIPSQLTEALQLVNARLVASHPRLSMGTLPEVTVKRSQLLSTLIRLQEDLDWECYRLYGLLKDDLTYPTEQSLGIQLGERAFEIVLARKMARGEVQTTWFERHGSTPITELPEHWPDDYRQLVERRIEVIDTNPQIALIEQPEYKRRWNTEPWDSQVERALKSWMLDRLESYFDFDGRMNDEGEQTSRLDIGLASLAHLADVARQDAEFLEVGEVYRDDSAFDVQRLVEELVRGEHVPLLPILRYKPAGLRKRVEWERTWQMQRAEDAIDARTKLPKDDSDFLTADQAADLKRRELGDIPVPPKYKSSDFISTGGARYWHLRGKLDVPKERWVSFPHCEGEDGTLMIAWAGYDHLQLARAISAYYVDIQERLGGRDDPRLEPLLACLIELLPWLKQWHNEVDPEFNVPMGDYFEGFIQDEARQMNKTVEEIKNWQPPQRTTRRRRKANT